MGSRPERVIARVRRAAWSLGAFDYAATAALVAIYVIGRSMDEGPRTSMDFYRAAATVISTLLITVAIRGRVFEPRKVTFACGTGRSSSRSSSSGARPGRS